MRPFHAVLAVLTIFVMAAAVMTGGHAILRSQGVGGAEQFKPDLDVTDLPAADTPPTTSTIAEPAPSRPPVRSRTVDSEAIASSPAQTDGLERIEPRAPLSDLALAGPLKLPKTTMPGDWKGTKLFQPVASAAGLIEAKGYAIAVSGIDVVGQDETCAEGDKSWACGMRARTAFRAFLRGRAVVCSVPPEGGRDRIAAECRVGNQDVGQWLVENGWARAAAAGPYVEAGDKARTEKKGIFGEAPDMSGLPPAPPETGPAPEAPASILDGNDGALSPPPPVDQPAPVE